MILKCTDSECPKQHYTNLHYDEASQAKFCLHGQGLYVDCEVLNT